MEIERSESASWVSDQYNALSKGASISPELQSIQRAAYEKFVELGVPTTGQEEWRYTNLTPVVRTSFSVPERVQGEGALNVLVASRALPSDAVVGRVVFVNGNFSSALSSIPSLSGVSITSLRQSGSGSPLPKLISSDELYRTEPFAAMNTALLQDALDIQVANGVVVQKPLEIIFLTLRESTPISVFPRLSVQVGAEASLSIVERHVSAGGESFCSSYTGFDVQQAGRLEHVFIQQLGVDSSQVATTSGSIARDGKYHSHVFQLGSALVRNEIRPVLAGVNGECILNGVTAITNEQHVDNYTVIDHATPHCYSREHYKGVYGGHSSGVFCGTIIVRQEAQKTNAVQSNQSLLLSPTATIDTKPQLKIWADDVKCTHGATVGQLDEDALFYLRARGVPMMAAKKMLIEAFVSEVLGSVPGEALRQQLDQLLHEKLNEML